MSIPDWARALGSEDRFQAFVEAVGGELLRRGYSSTILDGKVRVTNPGGRQLDFGLANLVQRCATLPPEDYAGVVRTHFDVVFAVEAEHAAFDAQAGDLDRMRSLLRVRLFNADYVTRAGAAQVTRREADDLFAGLVFNLPNAVRSVGPELVKAWERPLNELFDLALANVRAEGKLERQDFEILKTRVHVLQGPSYFAASHALLLDDYIEPKPREGTLVAVPNRHEVLFFPIAGFGTATAIATLHRLACDRFERGPGSLSDSLFWRHADGSFERVALRDEGGAPRMVPSEAFGDMVKRLTAS